MTDISLIIPFLNEEENLPELIKQLGDYAKKQDFTIEAIFVDDGSKDESVEVIRQTVSQASGLTVTVKIVKLSKNFGSHAAIRAGLTQAEGKYTMFFSADLQEPFEMIGDLRAKVLEGYDIAAARKASVQVSFSEKLFSGIYTSLIRRFAVRDYPKGGANNFLFSEKVRENLCANIESNSSIHLQIMSMGFKTAIIDVMLKSRAKGTSKWTFSKRVKLFIDSFLAYSYVPIRLISILGIILFLGGLIYALWIIIARLAGIYEFDAGFPTLISILLIGFGLTNFALGIIAEYIWRTLDASRRRPVFIIDDVEEVKQKPEQT